jgi:hypothetical protein
LNDYDFLLTRDLEESAREDIEYSRGRELLLQEVKVSGWASGIDTGWCGRWLVTVGKIVDKKLLI